MEEIYKKIETIRDVWNYNIWDYPYCQSEIKFDDEAKTNYFGDLMGYFQDTLDTLKSPITGERLFGTFSYHISLLQILYVQQDFIEELLRLFSTGYNKGDLKKDSNYSINREIRNELVGHPIRRDKTGKLISSTLFSYEAHQGKIEYLRYHQQNSFQFESVKHNVADVISRHEIFLNTWLDKIIEKLKLVVNKHKMELLKIKEKVDSIKFESLVSLLEQKYKPFLENTYLYNKESILKVYEKKDVHKRYRIVYDQFLKDLVSSLDEQIDSCDEVFTKHFKIYDGPEIRLKPIFYTGDDGKIHIDLPKRKKKLGRPKKDYNYPLQKLSDPHRRNYKDFNFFSNSILSQCKNKVVVSELNRMGEYLHDDVEYISSYRLVASILKD
ncbi:hypothetical protein [Flavobacterium caeni]|uniref:Uncharacterized protein n=1 Tax=Flavobacterium caeni TaxID=490189 RepID=A0A1G5KJJ4_9FLAO|nr:hypothetical protein [Flavobacterium caeni]SCZ00534.1 hypothetical protein SAMN02927903_03334 [Flavobacterium caeni]